MDVPSDATPTNGTLGAVQQGNPAATYYAQCRLHGHRLVSDLESGTRSHSAGRANVTVSVRAARSISFDVNKNKVKKGKKVIFSGDVVASGNVGTCESNQPLELQRKKPTQASFTTFAQLQTNATGGFSLKQKIKKTFAWRVVLGESQACEDAASNAETVKAKKKKKK